MSNRFANGAKSFGYCDFCGFRFDLKKLKNLVVKTKQVNYKVCAQCWTPDQPQLQLGMYPISDPQAIRDPRPDTNTWYQSGVTPDGSIGPGSRVIEWGWGPVGGSRSFDDPLTPNALVGRGQVGAVTVSATGTLSSIFFTTPGTYTWIAPAGITEAVVICVGGGGSSYEYLTGDGASGGTSSFGGVLEAYGGGAGTGLIGGAGGTGTAFSATVFGGDGGNGAATPASGGGGAGGYLGAGGDGAEALSVAATGGLGGAGGGGGVWTGTGFQASGGGGGVGLYGQAANGAAGGITVSTAGGAGGSSGLDGAVEATAPYLAADGGLYGGGGGSFNDLTNNYLLQETSDFLLQEDSFKIVLNEGVGGSGGGGGLRWSVLAVTPGTSYTVVVGSGGNVTSGGSGANGAVALWYTT